MIVMHTFCEDFHTVEVTKDFVSDVWEDGKISLKCKDNGKYLKGFGTTNEYSEADCEINADFCTELGVCDDCKFNVEIGTLRRVDIEIIGIEFGEFNNDIPPTPSMVDHDDFTNYSDETTTTQFKIM